MDVTVDDDGLDTSNNSSVSLGGLFAFFVDTEARVEGPTVATLEPTFMEAFKEGRVPAALAPSDIAQTVFASPVAPPPISEGAPVIGGSTTTAWVATAATAAVVAMAF